MRHGRPVEREWLAGTLWPETGQAQSLGNLRTVLSELRGALGSQGVRLQSPNQHCLLLDLAGAEADLLIFDDAIASRNPGAWERAVGQYTGPLLEGCTEEWVQPERDVREQECLRMLQSLAEGAVSAGDLTAAADYFRRAVGMAPLAETVLRGLMETLAHAGDSNGALEVYRKFLQRLHRDDPRSAPDGETKSLYMRLRNEARRRAVGAPPAAKSLVTGPVVTDVTGHPRHPPQALTALIGREDERLEIAALLRRTRLVTLTGPGGIGKTRLSLAIAAESVHEYPQGVRLVALDSFTDGSRVIAQIASVLGVKEATGQTLLECVTDHLRPKRLLLVLDNCEHLLSACVQAIGHILQQCAGIYILATSRETLGITGETVRAVPALEVPDVDHLPQGTATLRQVVSGYAGVQLFVERAQAVRHDFALTGDNAASVALLCARLEGIPLALELAAARVKVLSVEQIATRVLDHFGSLEFLTGGSRAASSRQQTLRGALDWSYNLLAEGERTLLWRLSVFSGGWDLDAAEAVAAGENIEPEEILDLLTSLVDKSLVIFESRDPAVEVRYRFLEMVRQYAAECLEASGEAPQVRGRHCGWYLALAEQAEPHLKGDSQDRWFRRLEAEHDNLRMALRGGGTGGTEAREAQDSLRLAGALYRFWYVRGYWSEGREHLNRALGYPAASIRSRERARALHGAGALAYSQGEYAAARMLLEESLSIRRELGDKAGVACSLNTLGCVAYDQGQFDMAWALHEESLGIRRELEDREGIAESLSSLGNIAHPRGEYALARTLYEESCRLFRELGDRQGIGRSLSCIAYVVFDQSDGVQAQVLFEESCTYFQDLGDRGGLAWSTVCLGYLAFDRGEYGPAQTLLEEGLNLFRELGDRSGVAWSLNSLGNVAQNQGRFAVAWDLQSEGLRIRRELGDRQGTAWSLICLGAVSLSQRDTDSAHSLLAEGIRLFGELGDRKGIEESLKRLAQVLLARNELPSVVRLWGAAQAVRGRIGGTGAAPQASPDRHTQHVEQVRSALGAETFAALWEEGSVLTLNQAVEMALTLSMSGNRFPDIPPKL
ncbi:MAG: tetratricopeptide repeat protein [Akkermansiaceae bacterium]|nr:tetratricopeptide repeat protein [Armatimonadota bacterium]